MVVITGDGSFGLGAMEFDTAVRHGVPIVCVIGFDIEPEEIGRNRRADVGLPGDVKVRPPTTTPHSRPR